MAADRPPAARFVPPLAAQLAPSGQRARVEANLAALEVVRVIRVDGEWFFLSAFLADSCEASPRGDTSSVDAKASRDASRRPAPAVGDTSSERRR